MIDARRWNGYRYGTKLIRDVTKRFFCVQGRYSGFVKFDLDKDIAGEGEMILARKSAELKKEERPQISFLL